MPANAGGTSDASLIPGSGRSPGVGKATCSGILAWKIPQTEELAGYSPRGCKESDMTEHNTSCRKERVTDKQKQ